MGGSVHRPQANFVEPTPIIDAFVTGICAGEALGGCIRLVFFAPQKFPHGEPTRAIRSKLVIPIEQLLQIALDIQKIAYEHGTGIISDQPRQPLR